MSLPHSTTFMIGPNRSRFARLTRTIHRTEDEAIFLPDVASFLETSKVRHPDCIVLDVSEAGKPAEEALQHLLAVAPIAPVLCLCADHGLRRAVRAMRMGAFDCLPISCTHLEFQKALNDALEYHRKTLQQSAQRSIIFSRFEQLTTREKQVFSLVASGLPTKEIAENLDLAPQTVKIHRGRVLAKMGATSTLDLYRHAEALRAALPVKNIEKDAIGFRIT